ncbi:MAG: glycerate kinase, partial [Candidatus Aminicenantes bacterium]|nr:glycerate kinase [Candidatus Aminicenantes bacterium]
PKPGDPVFERTRTQIIASIVQAAEAAEARAREKGYHVFTLATDIEGGTREAAIVHTALAENIRDNGLPIAPPACLISGGETTVTIRGDGKGGRNQEFALAAAIALDGRKGTAVLSCGTDGTDGPTDAAGAFADGDTVKRAATLGMNARKYLDNNDSYHFFKPLGDLVVTGPTHTNVMDLHVVLVC